MHIQQETELLSTIYRLIKQLEHNLPSYSIFQCHHHDIEVKDISCQFYQTLVGFYKSGNIYLNLLFNFHLNMLEINLLGLIIFVVLQMYCQI